MTVSITHRASRMHRLAILTLALLPFLGHAAEVAGVKVPDSVRVGGQELILNGAGLRAKAFFRIYVAALYLPQKKVSAKDALSLPGAKRLSMTLLRDITAQQLIDALNEGVRDNHSPAEVEKLRPRMEALAKIMSGIGAAKNGALITLDSVPGSGTQVGLDGEPRGTLIPGEDFYRALLRIWLGDDPVDASLRKALLGAS
jgi:long-chain acyl-CoA synthetase